MALLKCAEKNVLPTLNFPLSEYGASKDKGMARIVREVVQHFQLLRKALPQSVQKQLADAEAALAAHASLRKPAKRSRKADEQQSPGIRQEGSPSAKRSRKAEEQQSSGARQKGSPPAKRTRRADEQRSPGARQKSGSPAKLSAKRQAPSPQPAAPADSDCSSDASDLPEGVRSYPEPLRPMKRLKRMGKTEDSGSHPVRDAEPPKASAAPQMPYQPEHPSVKVSAPESTSKAARLSAGVYADSRLHEHGESSDSGTGHASRVLQSPKVRPQACERQPTAAASMQTNGAEAPAVQRREDQEVSGTAAKVGNGRSEQSKRTSPGSTSSPRKKRAQVQQAEAAETSKRQKLEPFRPPGAPEILARGRATMASLLFASQPAQLSSAQAASPPAARDKPECPACDSLSKAAAAASQPDVNQQPPQLAADCSEAGTADPLGDAPMDSSSARCAQQADISTTAEVKQTTSAQGPGLAAVISMKLGSLQRPDQAHGSAPSSREYIFSRRVARPSAGTNTAGSFQEAASNGASARGANVGEDTDWSTDGQQSADQADAHADIRLGSSGHATDAAASAQPHIHSSKDSRAQPSRLQKAGTADHADGNIAEGEPTASRQHGEAAFSSPPPPVRTLEDDLAEQVLPGASAAAAAQPVKAEESPATPHQWNPEHSLQPEQPQQEVNPEQSGQQAQAPPGSEAGTSEAGANGDMPESHRAAGTVADPVVISDSDSSDDELEVMPSQHTFHVSRCAYSEWGACGDFYLHKAPHNESFRQ